MNRQRVLEILEAHMGTDFDIDELIWDDYTPTDNNVEFMDGYRGYEDGGYNTWAVYKVIDGENVCYIRYSGAYNSWSGSEWSEDFDFVEPYEVVVTKFKTIEEPK